MPTWLRHAAAVVSGAFAIAGMFLLLRALNSRDIVHLYVRSDVPDTYELFEPGGKSTPNNYFPRVSDDGKVPVSFPVSSGVNQFRIHTGQKPAAIEIVRVCLERALFVNRCIGGNVDRERDVVLTPSQVAILRPSLDVPLFFVRTALALLSTAFLFCFFYSWTAPLWASWNRDATWVFAAAIAIRALFFANYQGGSASDSVLFESYLNLQIFSLPGIRGIVYPLFIGLFPPRATSLYVAQLLLGALGSVMVLMLIRSLKCTMKPASRWDILWALAATTLPTLLAMEMIVLSESLTLFLVLAALVAFRGLQRNGINAVSAAGLGACCALLYHTKPQFGFAILLFALALLLSRSLRSSRSIAAFSAPVIALHVLVIFVNLSAGNFAGVTSTLGYSLFDHAQQMIACPSNDPDLHIQYYCEARAAIGNGGSPTGYTAWVIYPTMQGMQQLFPEATAGYAELSFRLIAGHPFSYAHTVGESFLDFWMDDVPMVPGVIGRRGANVILPLDRFLRRCAGLGFFLSLAALFFKRFWRNGDHTTFHLLSILTVLGSASVQALAEAGNEQGRFAVPTMPVLVLVAVCLANIVRECLYNEVESDRPLPSQAIP